MGNGWLTITWGNAGLPTKRSLDQYFPDVPVYMIAADSHSIWLNSKALEEFETDEISPNIVRFPDGELTGVFKEGKATEMLGVANAHAYGMILDENGARDYDMYEFIWYSDFPDPSATMLCLLWGMNAFEGGTNQAMYVNGEVDALFDSQTASTDPKERSEQLLDICEIVNDELPYINFYYENNNYVLNKKYTYELSPFWLFGYRIKDVEVK